MRDYVFDAAAGETIADGLRREAAMRQIALLERLAKEQAQAEAEAAAGETMPVPEGSEMEGAHGPIEVRHEALAAPDGSIAAAPAGG